MNRIFIIILLTIWFYLLLLTPLPVDAQIFLDHFTDTNGTNISAHTPDIGSGWTQNSDGQNQINTNHAIGVTAAAPNFFDDYYYFDSGLNNGYTISALWRMGFADNDPIFIYLRRQSSTSVYVVAYNPASNAFTIERITGLSSSTSLGSFTYTHTTTVIYKFIVESKGDSIIAEFRDNDADTTIKTLRVSDSNYTGSGIGFIVQSATNTTIWIDDFMVEQSAAETRRSHVIMINSMLPESPKVALYLLLLGIVGIIYRKLANRQKKS